MNFTLNPGVRRQVVASGEGDGIELPDGRVLYVWVSGGTLDANNMRKNCTLTRGWVDSVDELLAGDLPTIHDQDTLMTALYGSPSLSIVDDRLIMMLTHWPLNNLTASTGSAFCPAAAKGLTTLESFDDGETWSTVGYINMNTTDGTGLGTYWPPGAVTSLGGGVWVVPAAQNFDYFGARPPCAGLWRSSDSGATWPAGHRPFTSNLGADWSRNVAVDPGGDPWWRARTTSATTSRVFYSTDAGVTLTTAGDTVQSEYVWASIEYMDAQSWAYEGHGHLWAMSPDHAGTLPSAYDKISGSADMGIPKLVGASRGRTLAFGRRWVDLVGSGSGSGWKIDEMGIG